MEKNRRGDKRKLSYSKTTVKSNEKCLRKTAGSDKLLSREKASQKAPVSINLISE